MQLPLEDTGGAVEISSDEENLPSGSAQRNGLGQMEMNIILNAIKNIQLCFGSSIFDAIQRESTFFGAAGWCWAVGLSL